MKESLRLSGQLTYNSYLITWFNNTTPVIGSQHFFITITLFLHQMVLSYSLTKFLPLK